MQTVTVGSLFIREMLEGALLSGYKGEDLLKKLGMPIQLLTSSKFRVATKQLADFNSALARLLKDESLNLLAEPIVPGSWETIYRAGLSGFNVEESLQIWKNAYNQIAHSVTAEIKSDEDNCTLIVSCDKRTGIKGNAIESMHLVAVHRYHCWLTNEFIPIEKVELNYPEPSYSPEYRFFYYGAPVHYNQKRNALTFSKKNLELSCNRSKQDINRYLEHPSFHVLTQPRRSSSISIKLRWWIERTLKEGKDPILKSASDYIGFTQQTLRRRLAEEGITFYQLKEETRRDIAIYMLKDSSLSVEDIAFQAGFSEASTFIRAFKRWTGMTPRAYRTL